MPAMKPAFLADFRNSRRVPPQVVVARNALESYVTRLGALAQSAANEPSFTHDPVALACLGLLNQEQRTNLALRSQEFDSASWTKINASVVADVGLAPDGTTTVDRLQEDAANSTHALQQSFTIASGAATCVSIHVAEQPGSVARFLRLQFTDTPGTNGFRVVIDPVSGAASGAQGIGSGTLISSGVDRVVGGWRVWVAGTAGSATSTVLTQFMQAVAAGSAVYAGDGTSGVRIWGAQVEAGSVPTSYIPTAGSQITRAANSLILSGSEFSSRYNPAAMTVVAKFVVPYAWPSTVGRGLMWFNSGTDARGIAMMYDSGNIRARYREDGGTARDAVVAAPAAGTVVTVVASFQPTGVVLAVNGVTATTTGSALTAPTVDRVHLHQCRTGGADQGILNCALLKAAWYPYAASQAECAAMSLSE